MVNKIRFDPTRGVARLHYRTTGCDKNEISFLVPFRNLPGARKDVGIPTTRPKCSIIRSNIDLAKLC